MRYLFSKSPPEAELQLVCMEELANVCGEVESGSSSSTTGGLTGETGEMQASTNGDDNFGETTPDESGDTMGNGGPQSGSASSGGLDRSQRIGWSVGGQQWFKLRRLQRDWQHAAVACSADGVRLWSASPPTRPEVSPRVPACAVGLS